MLITQEHNTQLDIRLTLEEMNLLGLWMSKNVGSSTKLNVVGNGCDIYDYYETNIILESDNDKNKLSGFIRSLSQESNFGGIRPNEYWINANDIELS